MGCGPNQYKLPLTDRKQQMKHPVDGEGVVLLGKAMPNIKARTFLDWFTYSDNTIDGQSNKKEVIQELYVWYLISLIPLP